MNVFDLEMGPLCDQETAERISLLATAGLSLDQLRAWERARLSGNERVN